MADTKWSQFPSASDAYADDEVVGLKNGKNSRFSFAKILALIRQNLSGFFVPTSAKGAANGVASLDSTGKVPSSQLPPIASTAADVTYDNTQSGLTADDVQEAIDELAAGAGGGGVDPETIAPVEESSTATTAHPLGTVFYFNDLLYRALADIPVGGTINTAAGGNATQTSIAQNFKRTVTLTSAEYAQLSAAEKAADIVYIITDDNTIPAEDVSYDPATSGLSATEIQAAVDELADGKANQAQLAYVETGTTATRNYTAGQYIALNGLLYTADTAIASGATFYTSGGNKNLTECVGGGFNFSTPVITTTSETGSGTIYIAPSPPTGYTTGVLIGFEASYQYNAITLVGVYSLGYNYPFRIIVNSSVNQTVEAKMLWFR